MASTSNPSENVSVDEMDHQENVSDSGSDEQPEQAAEGSAASGSQKKKKKKKKGAKMLKNLLKGPSDKVPQALVNEILQRAKQEPGASAEEVNEASVREAMEQMKILDVLRGKTGLGGQNKKEIGEHKFWSTQPVPQIGESAPEEDGPIELSKPSSEVRQDPYPLPKDFEWSSVDINDEKQLRELYELLSAHYVEDDDASMRFQYSAEFLKWALQPPGYHKEWHIGVRVRSNKKLVAFISGWPINIRVRSNIVQASEINYLCIHRKLRSKRLAPVLIKEVTRQCNLKGIFQAIYTAGVLLPTPVSICRYYHRSLNVRKLVETGFNFVPRDMTLARMIRQHKAPDEIVLSGVREMEERDVPEVMELYQRYMKRFDMSPVMTKEEIQHQFLSGRGTGESVGWSRQGQVVWSYVVEDPETHQITDFFTFYSLPSTVIGNAQHDVIKAAYLFYYASDVAFKENADSAGLLTKRLKDLIGDAIIVANNAGFDVFNALTLMDNSKILPDLKFGPGNGLLNFYLYNWRTASLSGVQSVGGVPEGRGVGVVML